MLKTLIGTRIRERRRARKLTQVALAKAAGVSPSYLNLIEHNRRRIAGRTLLAIARELDLQPAELADGADTALINTLIETAKRDPKSLPEVDRVEAFVGRYPGWAKLLNTLAHTANEQQETITSMTDQMAHDPFVSETMHQILSHITAIRSTAGILATVENIPQDQQERFLNNLHKDSQRLSAVAQKMVDFFDRNEKRGQGVVAASDMHDFWSANDYVISDQPEDIQPSPQGATVLPDSIKRFQNIEALLPTDSFIPEAKRQNYDPLALARIFAVEPTQILFRMAQMPKDTEFPRFGLIEVDMSGAVLMRKPTPELALPLHAAACPLWPLYRSFAQPGQILKATLEMPSGDQVLAYSCAKSIDCDSYELPPLLRATMIFSADSRVLGVDQKNPILAGLHCAVCPRKHCATRRVNYILA